jgi:hypothetical protein
MLSHTLPAAAVVTNTVQYLLCRKDITALGTLELDALLLGDAQVLDVWVELQVSCWYSLLTSQECNTCDVLRQSAILPRFRLDFHRRA